MLAGLGPDVAEAEGEDELAVAGGEIDLSGESNVAVFGAGVFPLHLEMLREILPAVGGADESDGHFLPRRRGRQRQRGIVVLGKKHGVAFVIADPAGIAVAEVRQVRREQSVKMVVGEFPLQRLEADLLQHDVAVRIGQNFFVDAVAPAVAGVDQLKGWNAGLKGTVFKGAVALLLGEEIVAVGDDESHVAGTGLVDAGKVNLVQNAVTQGEPDFAVLVEGRADAGSWRSKSNAAECRASPEHNRAAESVMNDYSSTIFSRAEDRSCA